MKNNTFYLLGLLLLFASCSKRNLSYISDIQGYDAYKEPIENKTKTIIKPDDLLGITVSSLNQEAAVVFNRGGLPASSNRINSPSSEGTGDTQHFGYLVDEDGYIDFPVLGKVRLAGMSRKEAQLHLSDILEQYLRDPVVNLRYLNYRITVMGEVNRPSTFTIPNEKINILEALGMAGDMTAYGKRENVMLIREEADERTVIRINLNEKQILSSPYFYLQQNDIVYVEPVKAKGYQTSNTARNISIIASFSTVVVVIVSRLL
jgi:polysaccharide export outer membrane protein